MGKDLIWCVSQGESEIQKVCQVKSPFTLSTAFGFRLGFVIGIAVSVRYRFLLF